MKTKSLLILSVISTVILLSCDVPLALGSMLDILGPVVEITAPVPRKAVISEFDLEGKVSDYSGVEKMEITAQLNRIEIPKRWRYYRGAWEVSEDFGANWQKLEGAQWNGNEKSADWLVPINMNIAGAEAKEGEYLFTVIAWDKSGFSDDNSFKTIVLIYDKDPPKVDISRPNLYSRFALYDGSTFTGDDVSELNALHAMTDGSDSWKYPEMIGKFLTQGFQLQWQIEDDHDLWSIEFRFYDVNDSMVNVDNDPDTPLPDTDYFRYGQNVVPLPEEPRLEDYIKPNGNVEIPTLHDQNKLGAGTIGSGEYHFKNTVNHKTTIRVVALCYDAAGHVNQEKTLGYFIYWPEAGKPWVIFTEGMEVPGYYDVIPEKYRDPISEGGLLNREAYLNAEAFMIYPGRSIKATALQAHGVTYVEFSLYDYRIVGKENHYVDPVPRSLSYMESMATEGVDFEYTNSAKTGIRIYNKVRSSGAYSQIFPWELKPPPNTGYYVVRAQAYSEDYSVKAAENEYEALFRVQDISFPIFGVPEPAASDPLFMHIDTADDTITISGIVTDATDIVSLAMVWINPQSRDFAAMSQLQYFRDQTYAGWKQAQSLVRGGPSSREKPNTIDDGDNAEQVNGYPYDLDHPNRLWNIDPVFDGVDSDERQKFKYSVKISLENELNISSAKQALRSQMFLLRAENPDGRVTIITYAPQGDTLVPTIDITEARILRSGVLSETIRPRQYVTLIQFHDGDEIEVYGTWSEDSTGYLNVNDYLFNKIVFKINGNEITGSNFTTRTITTSSGTNNATNGTFVFKATVGSGTHTIQTSTMKDTLVVDAAVRDIGGNTAESSASWLVQSERLRFLRISSEDEGAKNIGKPITIYLEFSKPVRLRNQNISPVLILNSATGNTATAVYDTGQGNENTRQYFTYTVASGQNAAPLDVRELSFVNVNDWTNDNYDFTWVHQGELSANETMRITMNNAHANDTVPGYAMLPTGNNNRSLMSNKYITVDTNAPTVNSVTATPAGWHRYDSGNSTEINIRVTFNENVEISDPPPYLILNASSSSPNNRALFSRATGSTVTFVYTVKASDNTNGAPLRITSCEGQIFDIPGTEFANSGLANQELAGVYLDTAAPSAPTVNIRVGNAVISNTINGTATSGTSGGTGIAAWNPNTPPSGNNIVDLKNVYQGTLNLQITQNSAGVGTGDTQTFEYSTNYGKDWIAYTGGTNGINWNTSNPQGTYQITARQIDRAGNVSQWSKPVVFNWDRDALITDITSTDANGTYTHNTVRQDKINITVNFRKSLTFTGTPGINLNSRTAAVTTSPVTGSQLNFVYEVANGDNSDDLDVTGFTGINARDGDGVDVSSMINIANVATANRLAQLKNIEVKTGALTVINPQPAFTTGTVNADGSYNTTLVINYSGNIIRGAGQITITQSAANYRIPAVLTEAQRNRYRGAIGADDFDSFYTRGTNGFNTATGAADTTVKYILNYGVDPTNLTQPQQTFAALFRAAEKITISAASTSAVTINGSQLTIHLTGNNALQVPGAAYTVEIPEGFVQDSLSNQSPAGTYNNITAGGVAKPFIRINRQQETIALANASTTQPRFVPTFPMTTNARMDTRTPGATIRYNLASQAYTATASNWATGTTTITTLSAADANNTNAMPTEPATPTSTTGTQYNAATPVSIGDNNYTGYIWRVNAAAFVGTTSSASSEEAAFRTVLTYQANNMGGTGTRQPIGNGMQIWIRGGDAIGSSSVPGFPLTWEDDWSSLDGKRAGIRLMRANTVGTNLSTSTWYWVTWEVNVETYFDIILGNTEANPDVNTILQYGPRQWAYQAAGWTAFKEHYRMFPGKHRWLHTQQPSGLVGTAAVTINGGASFNGVGALNFSATWTARPEF